MKKKILISLSVIAVVAAIAIGGTVALFSDTETSNGNIFTAGSIDLKVDHLAQTYNGDNCETCSINLFSVGGNTNVTDSSANAVIQTGFPFPAPAVTSPHPLWATNPPAQWVWASPATLVGDDGSTGQNVSYTFEREFQWWGTPVDVTLDLNIGADNSYELFLNGGPAIAANSGNNYNPLDTLSTGEKAAFISRLQTGNNTLKIVVTNHYNPDGGGAYNNPAQNPGGLLYDLTIKRNAEDCVQNTIFQNACQLWTETDLDGSQKFFNFGDIKPQDEGTNLISLHVSSNDAFVCLIPNNVTNDENGVVDPELEAGDTTNDGPGYGELQDEIEFFGWNDNGDGVYQDGEGILISAGTSLEAIQANMISMSLATTSTGYIGLAWCAGTQTVSGSTINCDGDGMSNIAQTDKAMANLVAYAVQQRNNEGFSCSDVVLTPTP